MIRREPIHGGVILRPLAFAAVLALYAFHRLGGHQREANWKILWPTAEAAIWLLFIRAYLDVADEMWPRCSAALCGIGALSFSIYMVHRIVIDTVTSGNWVFTSSPAWNTAILACPLTLGLSWLTYSLIERPFLELRGTYRRRFDPNDVRRAA